MMRDEEPPAEHSLMPPVSGLLAPQERRPELAAGEPEVLGPAPAPVVKVNNRFRYRCTLVGKNDKATREMLAWLQKDFAKDSANRGMNLFVDHNAAD